MMESSEWVRTAPLVIAHRGAAAYAPENTLAAYKAAVRMGADAVELDAKLLNDGTIIVLHDTTLDRTTDGSGSVYRYSYRDINHLDAGSFFSTQFSAESIPTLEQILEVIGGVLLINIELTNYARPWDKLPFEVVHLVRQYRLQKKVLLSSFNPWALILAKRMDPEIPRALLVHPGETSAIRSILKIIVDYLAYHPHQSLVSKKMIDDEKKRNKRINAWTVNEKSRMKELIDLGVNGIITDYPDIAQDVISEMKGS